MTNKTFKPDEVVAIFDNNGETMDRYTVVIHKTYDEEYENYTVASNEISSVWSVDEESWDYESITDENTEAGDTHIGKPIEWDELPKTLQDTIILYFELNNQL